MAQNIRPRVKFPASARKGETITIKTLINHVMESGHRPGDDGSLLPRSIIHRFTADFNGETIIDIAMFPAISSNPYFQFDAIVPDAGEFTFNWYDDDGDVYTMKKRIDVS